MEEMKMTKYKSKTDLTIVTDPKNGFFYRVAYLDKGQRAEMQRQGLYTRVPKGKEFYAALSDWGK